jgi:small subunit ribosomal protein S16
MPVKIRLARFGKKGKPFYHILVADGRAPRDGRFIERIGSYNPNTNPATIEINFDRALSWLNNGAQPTETCRAILSYKGILLKKHLDEGVKKGAFTAEVADERFNHWLEGKENQILQKKDKLSQASKKDQEKRLTAEQKFSALRAQAIAAKNSAEEAPVESEENTESGTAPAED